MNGEYRATIADCYGHTEVMRGTSRVTASRSSQSATRGSASSSVRLHGSRLMESMRIDEGYLAGPKGVVDEEFWWTIRR